MEGGQGNKHEKTTHLRFMWLLKHMTRGSEGKLLAKILLHALSAVFNDLFDPYSFTSAFV